MVYELRYKISKFHYEVILKSFVASLAYGMKKKLALEQPETYHKSKLYVKIFFEKKVNNNQKKVLTKS